MLMVLLYYNSTFILSNNLKYNILMYIQSILCIISSLGCLIIYDILNKGMDYFLKISFKHVLKYINHSPNLFLYIYNLDKFLRGLIGVPSICTLLNILQEKTLPLPNDFSKLDNILFNKPEPKAKVVEVNSH